MSTRRSVLAGGAGLVAFSPARAAILGRGRPYSTNQMNVICHGDSITAGVGVPVAYPAMLGSKLDVADGLPNTTEAVAWVGQGYIYVYPTSGSPNNLVQDLPVSVAPLLSGSLPNWLEVLAGTNDMALGGYTPAQTYAALQTYCTTAIALGIAANRIVVSTMLPRESFSEVLRSAFIDLITGDAGGIGYRVAPLHLDPCIGLAGQQNDSRYFQPDRIHPTSTGQAIISQIVCRTIAPN